MKEKLLKMWGYVLSVVLHDVTWEFGHPAKKIIFAANVVSGQSIGGLGSHVMWCERFGKFGRNIWEGGQMKISGREVNSLLKWEIWQAECRGGIYFLYLQPLLWCSFSVQGCLGPNIWQMVMWYWINCKRGIYFLSSQALHWCCCFCLGPNIWQTRPCPRWDRRSNTEYIVQELCCSFCLGPNIWQMVTLKVHF